MSNGSRLGTRREYDVVDTFVALGWSWLKSHRSGQSIEPARAALHIPGDVFVISDRLGLQIEVGGAGKRLEPTFAELRQRLLPGFRPLVVRFVGGKRWWYPNEDQRFADVQDVFDHFGWT